MKTPRARIAAPQPAAMTGGPSGTVPLMSWEYARVPWEQVGEHAARGWRLMPIPPVPEMKAMLGQVQMTGVVLYHLEREMPEADQVAQPDRAGNAGRSLWSGAAGDPR